MREAQRGPGFKLSEEDVYKALAANPYGKPNTAKTWKDVNPALPAVAISVFGPPSTSGTYDAFKELILGKGCDANPEMKALKDSDKDKHEEVCTALRGAREPLRTAAAWHTCRSRHGRRSLAGAQGPGRDAAGSRRGATLSARTCATRARAVA